jgi:hypothetical protein
MISQETSVSLGYHSRVRQIGVAVLFFALAVVANVQAQIHGVPSSVTSFGPGRGPAPGVPGSVTSLGPLGYSVGNPAFVLPSHVQFRRHHHRNSNRNDSDHGDSDRHDSDDRDFGRNHFVSYYPVPVYTPYFGDVGPGQVDDSMEEEDAGGPTLFDRRGPGPGNGFIPREYARDGEDGGARGSNDARNNARGSSMSSRSEATKDSVADGQGSAVASDLPATVLVFRDGHKLEVKNYAILGDVLYDLTPGHSRRIALSDLDLGATQKVNDDQGTSFQVPVHTNGS